MRDYLVPIDDTIIMLEKDWISFLVNLIVERYPKEVQRPDLLCIDNVTIDLLSVQGSMY